MTIVLFIIILAVLILSHEFGHFITAKKSGMKVEEFGIGFPPRLFSVQRGETVYSFNLIPFGGFVKIEGEDDTEKKSPRSFAAKPAPVKALVLVAGVAANIILAYLLFSFISWAGMPVNIGDETPEDARDIRVLISEVAPNSPAETAGVKAGDTILALKKGDAKQDVLFIKDVQEFVSVHQGETLEIALERGEEVKTIEALSRARPPEGEGSLGIALMRVGIVSNPWYQALWDGVRTTERSIVLVIRGFAEIIRIAFSGGNVGAYVAGPVGIVSLVGQSHDLGFLFLLQFTAIISVHLAVINLVPFPALDGGRLFFLVIETIIRRPLPKRITAYANTIGFIFLIALMLLITVVDVQKLL